MSLLICMFSLSIWFGDYNNAGNISIASSLVFIFSILFPISSGINLWVYFKKKDNIKTRVEKIYLFAVALTFVGLSIFLYQYEIVGLKLWTY